MKGMKYRIFPTKEQAEYIDMALSHCSYVWNGFLALKSHRFQDFGENLTYGQMSSILTEIKKTDTFLKNTDSTALQQTLKQLDDAYKRFFNGLSKYPKFKTRKNKKDKFKTTNISIVDGKLKIPKVNTLIAINIHRPIEGRIIAGHVSKNAVGNYFVSFTVEDEIEELPIVEKEVGVDLGLKTFAVCSDSQEYKAPRPMWALRTRLGKLQRRLTKRVKGSARYNKLKLQIAQLHERIANIRKDFLHKLSTKLVRENQSIYIEDLNIKGMVKNHKLAQAITDCGFGYNVQSGGRKVSSERLSEVLRNAKANGTAHDMRVINVTDNIIYRSGYECARVEFPEMESRNCPIHKVCNPNSKYYNYKGKTYRYLDENDNIIEKITPKSGKTDSKKIICIEDDITFDSITKCYNRYGISKSYFRKCMNDLDGYVPKLNKNFKQIQ